MWLLRVMFFIFIEWGGLLGWKYKIIKVVLLSYKIIYNESDISY